MRPYTGKRKYNSNLVFEQVVKPISFDEADGPVDVFNKSDKESYRVKAYKYNPNRSHKKVSKTFWNSTSWLVITLFGITIAIFILGMIFNMYITDAKANEADTQNLRAQAKGKSVLLAENKDLKLDLKVATAKPRPQQLTQSEAKEMIAEMFPQQFRQRFFDITAHCENSALKSDAMNINSDKSHSEDVGMSQINNKWQQARVEKMFGLDFDVAMRMPILNYIYAAYLVDHDQNFHQWSCDRIVKETKA